jgi:hypothetical protein
MSISHVGSPKTTAQVVIRWKRRKKMKIKEEEEESFKDQMSEMFKNEIGNCELGSSSFKNTNWVKNYVSK